MKVYVDLTKEIITEVEDTKLVFTGDMVSKLEVIPITGQAFTNKFVLLSAKLPNGRNVGPKAADEGATTAKYTFTLSKENGFALVAGATNFYIWIADSTTKKQKCYGAVVTNINKAVSVGDSSYFIQVDESDEEEILDDLQADMTTLTSGLSSAVGRIASLETGKQDKLTAGDITTTLIADGAVTTAKLADGNVTADKIGSGAVTNGKLGTNAVKGNNIDDKAVTKAKLSQALQNVIDALGYENGAFTFTADDLLLNGTDEVLGSFVSRIDDNLTEIEELIPSEASYSNQLADKNYVLGKIQEVSQTMIFKGTLGENGTITTLPVASSENLGYTYKVITDGTYQSIVCKVGDLVISTGSEWILIPSGDEPSGTVTNVAASGNAHITVSGSPITSSGTLRIGVQSGYSIPSDNQQAEWDAKTAANYQNGNMKANIKYVYDEQTGKLAINLKTGHYNASDTWYESELNLNNQDGITLKRVDIYTSGNNWLINFDDVAKMLYQAGKTYAANDIVFESGYFWISKSSNTNVTPSTDSGTNWRKLTTEISEKANQADIDAITIDFSSGVITITNEMIALLKTTKVVRVLFSSQYFYYWRTTGSSGSQRFWFKSRVISNYNDTTNYNELYNQCFVINENTMDVSIENEYIISIATGGDITAVENKINKPLYHLGAFDSADGKTRQTGVATKKDFVSYALNSASSPNFNIVLNVPYYELATTDVKTNKNISCYYVGNSNGNLQLVFSRSTAFASTDELTQYLQDIVVQYKLATSYTDTPIENQSILPLDTNMANKIRQKVVDGLNLLNNNKLYVGYIDANGDLANTSSSDTLNTDFILLKAGTYTVSSTLPRCQISIYNLSKAFQRGISWTTFTFTLDSDSYVRIGINDQSQTFTSSNSYLATTYKVMLNSGNHPYPYSDFNQKEHITNPQAELLKSEYEKCSNLIALKQQNISPHGNEATISSYTDSSMVLNITTGSSNSSGAYIIVPLESGKTYTISCKVSATSTIATAYLGLDAQKQATTLNATSGYTHASFTTTSSNSVLVFYFSTSQGNVVTISDIMLTETSYTVPYHEYCGEILHEVDAGVLLWENGSPNSAFTATGGGNPISWNTEFKYLIFAMKYYNDRNGITYIKVKSISSGTNDLGLSNGANYFGRAFVHTSTTSGYFENAYANGSINSGNNVCIPVAIYGTNIL